LDVKILLDAFSVPPVPPQATIAQLHLFLAPSALSMAMGVATAPTVMFGWGPNIIMDQAIVTKVSVSYQRFLMGVPVRAVATVSLQTVPPPTPLPSTNPTSGGLATRRTRLTVEGDTLASIAYQEYRDPNKWRALAEANGIDDPMRVKPGTQLIVPDRREAEQLA
jgi:nucleoid-associated protein YgaU